MNSMERYYQNNKGGKKEPSNSPEKKPDSTPLSSKVRSLLLKAFVGAGVMGIAAIGIGELLDGGAQRATAAAGLSPEMVNDPEVLAYALDHTTEEIRIFADNLARNRALILNNASNMEEMTVDLNTPMEDVQTDEAEAPIERFPLKQVAEGVYSFQAGQNIDVTSQNFIKQLRESLGQAGPVFFAVPDDNYGTTRIFTDSTINGYRDNYGNFYAYVGDLVYVSTDGQALNNLLDTQGIAHETFGLP